MAPGQVTRRTAVLGFLLPASLAVPACGPGSPPAPESYDPPEVAVMTAVVHRFRTRPPHRGFPLAVAPVTVSYVPERYPHDLRADFAAAAADLETNRERL